MSEMNRFVNLDDGWCSGEKRFRGQDRYSDLVDDADVLIVELGYGEPLPETFPGASRNPNEWMTVLQTSGRQVFLFMLWVPVAEAVTRKLGRMDAAYVRTAHRRYDQGGVCSQSVFLSRLGNPFVETMIRTDQQTPEATVEQILRTIRSSHET